MEHILVQLLFYIPEIITFLGVILIAKRIFFLQKSNKVFGEVTEIGTRQVLMLGISSNPGSLRIVHYPKIHFNDQLGHRHRLVVGAGGRFLSYSVGEKVPVIYLRTNPQKALLNKLYFVWVIPSVTTIIGIVSLYIKY